MYDVRADNEVVQRLLDDGPQGGLEPNAGTRRQVPELRRVYLSSSRHGTFTVGNLTAVWYLAETHDPERVVRAFLEENPQLVDGTNAKQALTQKFANHSLELKRAWQNIADEFDVRTPHADRDPSHMGPRKMTCGICGEDDLPDVASHIRNDCPET